MTEEVRQVPSLPPRRADSHKGDYGRALLIGGSRGMSGAIALCGMGALRGGAGLVTVATPDCCLETVAGFEPCYMTVPLPCDAQGRAVSEARTVLEPLIDQATAVGCGPGLGRSRDLTQLVRWLFTSAKCPVVLDADGLNALADHPQGLADGGGPRIVTPHVGEFKRLVGCADRERETLHKAAVDVAARHGLIVVLKHHRTFVTDGCRAAGNATGNPGMATGGAGDVLTGIIVALLCQGLPPWEAARLAVHVHGLAGDCAADALTQVAMTARDLVRYLPQAFAAIARDA